MNKPHRFTLNGNDTIRVMSLSVTGIEQRKTEPITKHLSHCKINQSSWPNQTDRSERNTKL